jgi:hypothetical protein
MKIARPTDVDQLLEALRDGSAVDPSGLRGLHVDPASRTARVRPGTGRPALVRAARKHGLAVGELMSAEVVTGDGRFSRVAGFEAAGVGIVTGLEFRLVSASAERDYRLGIAQRAAERADAVRLARVAVAGASRIAASS